MFKALVTVIRGRSAASTERFADRNALVVLDQQIRDASAALEQVKRRLAVAIAEEKQETLRLAALGAQITDLETRATAALQAGDENSAQEAAGVIATLEADRDAAVTAQASFSTEIGKMRRYVGQAQGRIADLQRGRRLAQVSQAAGTLRRGRIEPGSTWQASLSEAEQTLQKLRERQSKADIADEALDELDHAAGPVAERLAARGFGRPVKPDTETVLARLRAKLDAGG